MAHAEVAIPANGHSTPRCPARVGHARPRLRGCGSRHDLLRLAERLRPEHRHLDEHPWKTIARVNKATLVPGDTVRLEAGQTFSDTVLIPPASGSQTAPITFTAYSAGRARLTQPGNTIWTYDLWYGGSTAVPQNQGDIQADPLLTAPPELAPTSSSPGNDAGTTAVSGLTYSAVCDGAPLHYCGSSPDLGAVEYTGSSSGTPPASTSLPAISPTTQADGLRVGGTVAKTSDGTWTGTAPIGYSYQWQACTTASASSCGDIGGATAISYALQAAQQGLYVRLAVTATNSCSSGCGSATAYSPLSTDPVGAAAAPPFNTAPPTFGPTTLAGGLRVGGTVTKTSDGTWRGTLPIGLSYQWQACKTTSASSCANIAGATASSYVLRTAQRGQYIRLGLTAANSWGQATAYSALSADPVDKRRG